MRLLTGVSLGLSLALQACATCELHQQFERGVAAKHAGDAQYFTDTMISLADEAPASREGRRARTMIQGLSWLSDLTLLNALGAALGGSAPPPPAP